MDFGIYYGGTSMVIAYFRDGKNDVIVNEAGDRTTPSVLAVNDNEILIGLNPKQNLIRNSENTILYAKHLIGKTSIENDENLDQILKKDYCKVRVDEKANEIVFDVEKNGKDFTLGVRQVVEYELKFLLDLAKSSLGIKDNLNAVLSVPCYFSEEQTKILMECGTKVGFNIHRMIKNPFAACLAYDCEEDGFKNSKLLVYQMSSSTLEITLIELINGLYRKIDSINTFKIGGDAFTDVIISILCEEFKRKNRNLDPRENKRSLFKLKTTAEYLKHILSTMERAHCSIDALCEGIDFDYYLTRQRFEGASQKLYESSLQPIDELLNRNNLKTEQIDKVILCGAPTKMCKLQSIIKDKFLEPTQTLTQVSPDETIALGCAKQSFLITSSKCKKLNQNDNQFQCISDEIIMRIGSETNENYEQVFPLHAPIPLKRSININLDQNLPFVLFLFEKSKNKLLTKIDLSAFKTKEISCLFRIKFDGTFEISTTELATNQTIATYLNSES